MAELGGGSDFKATSPEQPLSLVPQQKSADLETPAKKPEPESHSPGNELKTPSPGAEIKAISVQVQKTPETKKSHTAELDQPQSEPNLKLKVPAVQPPAQNKETMELLKTPKAKKQDESDSAEKSVGLLDQFATQVKPGMHGIPNTPSPGRGNGQKDLDPYYLSYTPQQNSKRQEVQKALELEEPSTPLPPDQIEKSLGSYSEDYMKMSQGPKSPQDSLIAKKKNPGF